MCVGFTSYSRWYSCGASVHPHMRGGYLHNWDQYCCWFGPSPRVWGLPLNWTAGDTVHRSVPTHVGGAPPCCSHGRRSAVHPHARRVYRPGRPTMTAATDSFPRAWDLRRLLTAPPPGLTVHPHVRGVYLTLPGQKPCAYGPSLRAWGLLLRPAHFLSLQRSIPTCVGVTVLALLMMPFPYGPSPPMRGLH